MAIDPLTWLWTPHPVVWRPKTNAARTINADVYGEVYGETYGSTGSVAADGLKDSTLRTGYGLKVFLEPLSPAQAEFYGVIGVNRPYRLTGYADQIEPMMKGDLIEWGMKVLQVEVEPMVYRPGDGYDSAELFAYDRIYGRQTL